MKLIMVIESDPGISADLEHFLQGHRMRVVITSLSKRMIDYIKSADPDVILLGVSFDRSQDLEFVISLRKDPFTDKIPVIGMIPRKDENFVQNYKLIGFSDYVVKPFAKSLVIDKVKTVMEEYSQFRKHRSDSVDSHIEIVSHGFNTVIYLRSSLGIYVARELKDKLSHTVIQRLRDDTVCLDIRGLFVVIKTEIVILEKIIKLFEGKPIYIVAGKHFGFLLENGIQEKAAQIFITPEEYTYAMVQK